MTPEKFEKRHPVCEKVAEHGPASYFEQADAYACMKCDQWIDERCTSPACEYCTRLAATPSKHLS